MSNASAQLGLGQPQPPQAPSSKPSAPAGPETHAASGSGEGEALGTTEPPLPADPLAIPKKIEDKIGTDADRDVEIGKGPTIERKYYGLYYSEESNQYKFRTLFPLWAERVQPSDRATFISPIFYQRRSTDVDADVAFPLFWNLRYKDVRTTIAGPFLHRESEGKSGEPARHDNWAAPIVFEGSASNGSGYLHIPPLLTFTQHTDRDGLNIVGPLFCKWKGGAACDKRTADNIDLGLAPFYFYGRDEGSEYEIIPPLLHYYKYSDVGDRAVSIWGPVYSERSRETNAFNVFPFLWHNWSKNEDHFTLFPLFHYGSEGLSRLLVTPLFLTNRGQQGEKTFVTWGYASYRGRTELDMWTPLFFWYRDPDIDLDRKLLFPFFYRNTSPRGNDLALFPLYGHFEKKAISETTWITPLFRHTTDLTGWETDIYPLFYSGRSNGSSHLVVAPLLWDFASPRSRSTVLLPGYYRFSDEDSLSQLVLNTYYHEERVSGGTDWELHVFPLFSYGQSPKGYFWNVLFGMAGYTREGTMSKVRALYIPIKLSE